MRKHKLKDLILSLTQDVVFCYNGQDYCINPFNSNKFEVGIENDIMTFNDIDVLMSAKIFQGECLNNIADAIEMY